MTGVITIPNKSTAPDIANILCQVELIFKTAIDNIVTQLKLDPTKFYYEELDCKSNSKEIVKDIVNAIHSNSEYILGNYVIKYDTSSDWLIIYKIYITCIPLELHYEIIEPWKDLHNNKLLDFVKY